MNAEPGNTVERVKALFASHHCCVIIPTYNNEKTIVSVIEETLAYTRAIIVVNDGSTDATAALLSAYEQRICVLHVPTNRGKGFALRTAFNAACRQGYAYAITIDSDGQHATRDYERFLEQLSAHANAVIIGARNMEQDSVPGKSNFGRKFSNFWFTVETGHTISDTQSGFRLYPLALLSGMTFYTNRYEFEIEVLVRLAWRGADIMTVPVSVYYAPKEERVSHFRPFTDFSRVSILNTVLVTLALVYFRPVMLVKKALRLNVRELFKEHFIESKESNLKLSLAVALGILCGILPVWGYQMALALLLAYVLKLNKVVSVLSSNISIPAMIPLILYGSYAIGKLLVGSGPASITGEDRITFEFLKDHLYPYIVGSIVLAIAASIVFGLATFVLLSSFRKKEYVSQ